MAAGDEGGGANVFGGRVDAVGANGETVEVADGVEVLEQPVIAAAKIITRDITSP